jgi:glutathione S-transferase
MEEGEASMMDTSKGLYVLHGLKLSYFTGKLEAYFQTKGIPFRYVEMDTADFRACAKATGIAQMPQVETPEGDWLTDTTEIIKHFEAKDELPLLSPQNPSVAFCSLLLEDLFDEWLWRPALYYRWAFDEDARLMSAQIARTMMRDMRLPFFVRQQFILRRQRRVFLNQDGVTKETKSSIETLYLDSLRELELIFSKRDFLFGDTPCEADFGLFGPFFRHFFSDPTPGLLMREKAPAVAHWVTRLWKTRPADLAGVTPITSVPNDLQFFFDLAANDYLPYLEANARAFEAGEKDTKHRAQGVAWSVPTAPYRVECFNVLKKSFGSLNEADKSQVADHLPAQGMDLLNRSVSSLESASKTKGLRDRLWK